MNLFLLAAGEGTRFRPHTHSLPKPAIPFCGLPLINYSYFLAEDLNLKKIVINTFHLPEQIQKVGEALSVMGDVEVLFSHEQGLLLGGGGGLAKAKPLLVEGSNPDEAILVMNADEVIVPKKRDILKDFYQKAQSSTEISTLLVMQHSEVGKKFGAVWVDAQGLVRGFGKSPPEGQGELKPYHFIGPMVFKQRIFNYLKVEPSNILHDNLKQLIAQGERVGIYPIECDWYETGNLADYLLATQYFLLSLRAMEHPLIKMWWEKYWTDWELKVTSGGTILKHESAHIADYEKVEGFAILGQQCRIGKRTLLKNVVCNANVVLEKEKKFQDELFL